MPPHIIIMPLLRRIICRWLSLIIFDAITLAFIITPLFRQLLRHCAQRCCQRRWCRFRLMLSLPRHLHITPLLRYFRLMSQIRLAAITPLLAIIFAISFRCHASFAATLTPLLSHWYFAICRCRHTFFHIISMPLLIRFISLPLILRHYASFCFRHFSPLF